MIGRLIENFDVTITTTNYSIVSANVSLLSVIHMLIYVHQSEKAEHAGDSGDTEHTFPQLG